jgi:hypothetical protein
MKVADYDWALNRGLQDIAIFEALNSACPNSRSPAFALQALAKVFLDKNKSEGLLNFFEAMRNTSEVCLRGVVSWNGLESCWQLGHGKHVPALQIVKTAMQWYACGLDFSRHTRDSNVIYPEDIELNLDAAERTHLSNALMPLNDEITRRIFTVPDSNRIGFIDVSQCDDDHFEAYTGWFDDYRTHRIIEPARSFWQLEVLTVYPLLTQVNVLAQRVQSVSMKDMGWMR